MGSIPQVLAHAWQGNINHLSLLLDRFEMPPNVPPRKPTRYCFDIEAKRRAQKAAPLGSVPLTNPKAAMERCNVTDFARTPQVHVRDFPRGHPLTPLQIPQRWLMADGGFGTVRACAVLERQGNPAMSLWRPTVEPQKRTVLVEPWGTGTVGLILPFICH